MITNTVYSHLSFHIFVMSFGSCRDRMVVGFTTTWAINQCLLLLKMGVHGKVYSIQYMVSLYGSMSVLVNWSIQVGWFGLWCLTPLSTIFQLYRGGKFYWILPDKDPYHNRGRDQMRKKGVQNSRACASSRYQRTKNQTNQIQQISIRHFIKGNPTNQTLNFQ
jgi:ribosomal protein L33